MLHTTEIIWSLSVRPSADLQERRGVDVGFHVNRFWVCLLFVCFSIPVYFGEMLTIRGGKIINTKQSYKFWTQRQYRDNKTTETAWKKKKKEKKNLPGAESGNWTDGHTVESRPQWRHYNTQVKSPLTENTHTHTQRRETRTSCVLLALVSHPCCCFVIRTLVWG